MRWGIACLAAVLGCRSTHVSELPLVYDVNAAPSALVVETCTVHVEHVKDYTFWPALLFVDMVVIFTPGGTNDVGLSIESWGASDTPCHAETLSLGGAP
jgi:hypothetical protein